MSAQHRFQDWRTNAIERTFWQAAVFALLVLYSQTTAFVGQIVASENLVCGA